MCMCVCVCMYAPVSFPLWPIPHCVALVKTPSSGVYSDNPEYYKACNDHNRLEIQQSEDRLCVITRVPLQAFSILE